MLRVFYIAVHETRGLMDTLRFIAGLSERLGGRIGVRLGILANWLRWGTLRSYLEYARRAGLTIMVDNGGFQGQADPGRLARWACINRELYDYILVPDRPAALCLGDGTLDAKCAAKAVEETIVMARRFIERVASCGVPAEKVVPVVQGYDVDSYLRGFTMLREAYMEVYGVEPGLVAIGSAKLWGWRSRDRERRGRLRQLIVRLGRMLGDGVRLHLLGVHGRDLWNVYAERIVHSADSGSQGLNYKYKFRTVLGCRTLTAECYRRSIEREVTISLKPLLEHRMLVA